MTSTPAACGGVRAKDGACALAGALPKPRKHGAERGPAFVGPGARRGVAVVPVEPGASHEVAGGRAGALKRVVAARDDAGGDLEQRLAAKERGEPPSAVDADEVQVALAVFEQAHALREGHGAKPMEALKSKRRGGCHVDSCGHAATGERPGI